MTKKLLMGNELFAHAALEAGVNVVAGYPGTPSSELVETVAKCVADKSAQGVYVEWSTNEKVALEFVAGAALCGQRALFTCKQVGLNVASDVLLSLNYIGTKGGIVLFVADDPGPISSQTEQDTRRFAAFSKVPLLDPSTPEQGFYMMKQAFELSEKYQTPVIVRPTTRVCHASTFFDVADNTKAKDTSIGVFEKGSRWVVLPGRAYEAHAEINNRLKKIASDYFEDKAYESFNRKYVFGEGENSQNCAVIAGGVSAGYALEAMRMIEEEMHACNSLNVKIPKWKFLQIGTTYPFPNETVAAFICEEQIDRVLVFEELDDVIEDGLFQLAGRFSTTLEIFGKSNDFTNTRGENSVETCIQQIVKFYDLPGEITESLLGETNTKNVSENFELPARQSVLCAGCPHRGSFYVVKKALASLKMQDAVLCGDIGCYTLGKAAPLSAIDTCVCMGAGVAMAQGFSVADPSKKHVAFVGDSTFFASAIPELINAVYNCHNICVCVLDNATTAMTGAQPHPGTGSPLIGEAHNPISAKDIFETVGFEYVAYAKPFDIKQSQKLVSEALLFDGPSAVIFTQPCIQLKKPGRAVAIDSSKCSGCKTCIAEIACPAISFDVSAKGPLSKDRGQACIDVNLCDGCGLCVQVCKFNAIQNFEDNKTLDQDQQTKKEKPKSSKEDGKSA